MANERHVSVFWDESVIPAARCSGFDAARFVCRAAGMVGAVRSFKYYVDVKSEGKGASPALLPELKTAGVTVVDTASNARAASAAKMLITDVLIHAMDNPAPRTLLLVSADPDVCYGISLLRMRGYQVYLLCPTDAGPGLEEFQLPVDFDASDFLETAQHPPFGHEDDSTPRQRSRSRSAPRSRGSSKPPVHDMQANGLQAHIMEAPPLLPPSEIDAFRQRFTTSRPGLDTAGMNPFKPHRHSFSSFGRNGPPEPQAASGVPSLRDLGPRLNVDLKGKGRAVDPDSTVDMDSPIILTATSMSVSRSNSFGSAYRAPPSTAPTSAMPWYRPEFKMGGEGKYEDVVAGGVMGSDSQNGAAEGGSEEGEEEEEGTPIRIARSVSGTTDGSVTPTASPETRRSASRAVASSERNGDFPMAPERELPQRIQVHASPPAATAPDVPAHSPAANNAVTGVPSAWTSGPAHPAASTIPDTDSSSGSQHVAAPSVPPSSGSASDAGIALATTAAAQSMTDTSSTPRRITRPERRANAARTARAASAGDQLTPPILPDGQSEVGSPAPALTPPIASTSAQPVTSSSSSSSSASSLDSIIERFPGVPSHFTVLIEVLREHIQAGRNSVARSGLCQQLFTRQRGILASAGTAQLSKPFVHYFNAAYRAGIITSATGDVALAEQYRQSI